MEADDLLWQPRKETAKRRRNTKLSKLGRFSLKPSQCRSFGVHDYKHRLKEIPAVVRRRVMRWCKLSSLFSQVNTEMKIDL